MELLVIRNFLSLDKCQELNEWVDEGVSKKWLDFGTDRGNSKSYQERLTSRMYAERFTQPSCVSRVFDEITNRLDFHHLPKSKNGGGKDGVVVSCTFPNGDVYKHKDPMEENGCHVLRCNIMTRKADEGAELFIDDQKIDIGVGDLHCYLPSDMYHYVTPVQGNTSRVMWMFGYQIQKSKWLEVLTNSKGLS
jgi:hypothetical protein